MCDVELSSVFADAEAEIPRLRARIEEKTRAMEGADPDRQGRLRWWIYKANEKIRELEYLVRMRDSGEHEFLFQQAEVRHWAVCSCGARFRGEVFRDFTLEEFLELPGHVRGPQ